MLYQDDLDRMRRDLSSIRGEIPTILNISRRGVPIRPQKCRIEYTRGARIQRDTGTVEYEWDCVLYGDSDMDIKPDDRFVVNDQSYVVKYVSPDRMLQTIAYGVAVN